MFILTLLPIALANPPAAAEVPALVPQDASPAALSCPADWEVTRRDAGTTVTVECAKEVLTGCTLVIEPALGSSASAHFLAENAANTAAGATPLDVSEAAVITRRKGELYRAVTTRSPFEGHVTTTVHYVILRERTAGVMSCMGRDQREFDALLPTFDAIGTTLAWKK